MLYIAAACSPPRRSYTPDAYTTRRDAFDLCQQNNKKTSSGSPGISKYCTSTAQLPSNTMVLETYVRSAIKENVRANPTNARLSELFGRENEAPAGAINQMI